MKYRFTLLLAVFLFSIYSNGQLINDGGIQLNNKVKTTNKEIIVFKLDNPENLQDSTQQNVKPAKTRRLIRKNKRKRRKAYRKRKNKKMIYGGCCFVEGTQILLPNGYSKSIDNLTIGDSVLSYDFNLRQTVNSTILKIDMVKHDNIVEITFVGNIRVKNTADHPYYVVDKGICSFSPNDTYLNYGIETNQLQIGDLCYTYETGKLKFIRIEAINKIEGSFTTYNISQLDKSNNYFVNGILVNNEKLNAPRINNNKRIENNRSNY